MRWWVAGLLLTAWLADDPGSWASPLPDDGLPCQGRRLTRATPSGWEVFRDGDCWKVCRGGQLRYRGGPGLRPPDRLVEAPSGPVAFVEREPARCQLVVVFDDDEAEPLRLELPRCGPGWRPHWVSPSSLHVGPSALDPRLRIHLDNDSN
jgi:hypothetical protein